MDRDLCGLRAASHDAQVYNANVAENLADDSAVLRHGRRSPYRLLASGMISRAIMDRAVAFIGARAEGRWFRWFVGACAFLVTITLTLPVELLVVSVVLVSPIRWMSIGVVAAIGSSLASVALYLAFHHLGWAFLIQWYPDIAASRLWIQSTRWLSEYGAFALFALMALPLPIPKTPALAFVAIYRLPVYEVVLAIGLGKLLKYPLYGYVVSRFPLLVARWSGFGNPDKALIAETASQSVHSQLVERVHRFEVRRWLIWRNHQQ